MMLKVLFHGSCSVSLFFLHDHQEFRYYHFHTRVSCIFGSLYHFWGILAWCFRTITIQCQSLWETSYLVPTVVTKEGSVT